MRAIRVFALASLSAAIAASSCNCDDELTETLGSMSGRACSEVDRQGLPNIRVEVRGPTEKAAITSADGSFRIGNLRKGDYEVFAILEDGTEQQLPRPNELVTVEASDLTSTPVLDDRCGDLPPPPDCGDVDGQVCNRHTGELISEAVVQVIAANDDVIAEGTTDENGNFALSCVPQGDHVVSIQASGFTRAFPVSVEVEETTTLDLAEGGCQLPFSNGCSIFGSLCDPREGQGSTLVGARVRVHDRAGDAEDDVFDISDTFGEWYVSGLAAGRYDVTITHAEAGVNETFSDVACVAGEETAVLGPDSCVDRTPVGRLQGKLCDLVNLGGHFTGTAILKRGATEIARVDTDDEGFFRFNAIDVGTYDLHLGDPTERIISPVVITAFQTSIIEEETCPEPADICEEFTHEPDVRSDGRILFVVDRSGSMNNPGLGTGRKWDSLKTALAAVTSGLAGTVEYGLFAYPGIGAAPNCSAGTQQQAMGATANAINTSLNQLQPDGGTPTAATMTAARATVQALASSERPVAVVLATDGAPNCNLNENRPGISNCRVDNGTTLCNCTCTSNACQAPPFEDVCQSDTSCAIFNCLDDGNSTNAIAAIKALGVDTHVVGITDVGLPPGLASIFQSSLNNMAVAGGAPLPGAVRYHEATSIENLQASLEAITRRILACQITTPIPLAGGTSLEVRLGNQPIPQDPTRRNGWDQTGASSIQLFGSACDAATASLNTVTVRRCRRP